MNEADAMRLALQRAATPGVPLGPNPRVGCVLLRDGEVIATGYHRGAGTPHAEADALNQCPDASGATAIVTLEPCNHTGRTGPCAQALIDAGVTRVVYALDDPNPLAAGGAQTLREAGVEVTSGLLADEAESVNRAWLLGVRRGRPMVTWKFAATLDGRSAAADGTSKWITGPQARADVHRLRGECDVILVGTGTAAADDPLLTVRDGRVHQPLRAVMGLRDVSPELRVFNHDAETILLRTREPAQALAELYEAGRRHVWLEGGPTLASAFLQAGLVDEIIAYLAPALLGAGRNAVADLGVSTIGDTMRLRLTEVTRLGGDLRLTLTPMQPEAIPPDTKDWTFVITEGCPECGFTPQQPPETGARLRATLPAWQAALAGPDARDRPAPQTWSATEYACHVRDVCTLFAQRLALMLTHDDPEFPNWDQDAAAVVGNYFEQDPAVVSAELRDAAEATAAAFDAVRADQWERTGRRSNGSTFSVATFAVYFLHDIEHHGWDVSR